MILSCKIHTTNICVIKILNLFYKIIFKKYYSENLCKKFNEVKIIDT